MSLLIKNGTVIDPANNLAGKYDILVEGGYISAVARGITAKVDILDAEGKIVMPGLVDMHAHLREPGREDKETVFSGTKAAIKGGITSLLAMPNTAPAIDCPETVSLLKEIIARDANAEVFICGAITKKRIGEELTDIRALKNCGIIAISDDGASVENEALFEEALKKAKEEDVLVICHCEDRALSAGGVVNLGIVSTRLGLRGISRESEYKRIIRDVQLAEKTGARIHIAHISCKESVAIIAEAKKRGIQVTCETAPHYFSLTEESVLGYDTNMKMNPPLRSQEDVEAIRRGLIDGTIDVIASDHAPHTKNEKEIEFDRAEFGVVGLETELAVAVKELVSTGLLDWKDLARKLSYNPARILNIDKGSLSIGHKADIIVVSEDKEWIVDKKNFVSKSQNSPFINRKLKGIIEHVILGGKIADK